MIRLDAASGFTAKKTLPINFSYEPVSPNRFPARTSERERTSTRSTRASTLTVANTAANKTQKRFMARVREWANILGLSLRSGRVISDPSQTDIVHSSVVSKNVVAPGRRFVICVDSFGAPYHVVFKTTTASSYFLSSIKICQRFMLSSFRMPCSDQGSFFNFSRTSFSSPALKIKRE